MPQSVQKTADNSITIMVAGGGTAGHIEPALAVADAIMHYAHVHNKKIRVIALGTHKGLDSVLIPPRGYQLEYTDPIPLPRTISLKLLTLPFRIIKSVWKTRCIIYQNQVKMIIGFGGYVALSGYLAARIPRRVRVIVHEANIRPGLANKIGAHVADLSVAAHKASGFGSQIVGIPVRRSIACLDRASDRNAAREKYEIPETAKVLLIFGGSQGAQRINEALSAALPQLIAADIYIIHAYGPGNEPVITREEISARGKYLAFPYIEDMSLAYAACDLVIARAGAMTVAELSHLGIPAIYIPLGHGNGEQALNAAPAVQAGAAILLEDSSVDGAVLEKEILNILGSAVEGEKSFSDRYIEMKTQAQRLVAGDAAETMAQLVLGLIDGK